MSFTNCQTQSVEFETNYTLKYGERMIIADNSEVWIDSILDNRYPLDLCEVIYTLEFRGAFIYLKMKNNKDIYDIPLFIEGCVDRYTEDGLLREVSEPKDTLGYRFECIKLDPYKPTLEREISPKEYVLTIKITKL